MDRNQEITATAAEVPAAPRVRVGLIGHGIQLSRTPRMHMDEGRERGFDYSYDLFDTAIEPAPFASLLRQVEAKGYRGVNVTHPFKQEAIRHLDELSDAARAVNAVNTIVFQDGKRFGHNTDYWGFAEAFRRTMQGAPTDRVLLLGAGGAGGAVANALLDLGVGELFLFDAVPAAARALAERLADRVGADRVHVAADVESAMAAVNGVVNATPVGMDTFPGSPVPVALLNEQHWVADIVYFPLETELLRAARARGCRTMDGSGMAVFQAVRAFELFTGVKADPDRMRATFEAFSTPNAGSSGT